MSSYKKAIYVGSLGFPFGSAAAYRKFQISSILNNIGYKVLVINRRGSHIHKYSSQENIKVYGSYNNINYFHTSLKSFRPNNFINRNIFKVIGYIVEFFTIAFQKFYFRCKIMICDSTKLNELKYYYYLSRLFKIKFIYDYVEFVDSLSNRDAYSLYELNLSFDKHIDKYADGFIVISSYLEHYLDGLNSNLKKTLIPPTINFETIDNIQSQNEKNKYLLYCGSIGYLNAINFIIQSYIDSESMQNDVCLYLIINGNELQLKQLNEFIYAKHMNKWILVYSQISYDKLISFYKSAVALLIPLSNNIQDNARFPFKIVEYLASKRPIITTNIGIVKEYFIDNETAFIATSVTPVSFTEKINIAINQIEFSNTIGLKGYNLGKSVFQNNLYNLSMQKLINSI